MQVAELTDTVQQLKQQLDQEQVHNFTNYVYHEKLAKKQDIDRIPRIGITICKSNNSRTR